jgi:hypothetical protein
MRIEFEGITPGANIKSLSKLSNKFPNIQVYYTVILRGSKEHGNTTGIDDAATLKLFEQLNSAKSSDRIKFKTGVHLTYGFADMFNCNRNFNNSKIWNILGKETDRVVFNFNTLTDRQMSVFNIGNRYYKSASFINFLATKANPNSSCFTNSEYYVLYCAGTKNLIDNIAIYSGVGQNTKNFGIINFDKDFDNWLTEYKVKIGGIPAIYEPVPIMHSGGITPDNVSYALDALKNKNVPEEKINICSWNGVMTDGKTDMDKMELFLKRANDWQTEMKKSNFCK